MSKRPRLPLIILIRSLPGSTCASSYTNSMHFYMIFATLLFLSFHPIYNYSRTSIYRSRIYRFPAFTIRHFRSRKKSHINNVIYSRINSSANYRFPAFVDCKSRSRHSFSRVNRLKKKFHGSIYLRYILFELQIWQHSSHVYHVTFSLPSAISR